MSRKSYFWAGALAAILIASPMSARAESLFEALTSAYVNNPNIASALLAVKSSAEGIASAKAGKLPTIGMGADVTESFSVTSQGGFTDSQSFSIGGSYRQNIFDNYQTDAQIEQARALTELASQALRNAEQNVLLNVAEAYMSVIRDQQLVQLRADSVEFFRAQVDSANDRLRIGEGTKIDVSQAEARLAQGVASYRTATFQLQASIASYERWVGHKPKGALSQSFKFGNLLPTSIEAAITLSDERHPAILSAKAGIRAAQSGADAAKAGFGPTLDLIGSIGLSKNFTDSTFSPPPSIGGSIKLSLSIPLYTGGQLGAGVRKSNIELIKSEVDAYVTRDQVREAVISSWATLQNAVAQIESANAAVASGTLVLEGLIQERDVGQRTTLDVLNAQSELTSTKQGLIQAQSSKVIATFALIAATGRLSAEELGLPVEIKTGEGYIAKVEDVWAELRSLD